MAQRIGTWTLNQLIAHCKTILKDYTAKNISKKMWQDILNQKVDEAHELLGLKDAPEYKMVVAIDSGTAESAGWLVPESGYTAYYMDITHASATAWSAVPETAIDRINLVRDENRIWQPVSEEEFWNIVDPDGYMENRKEQIIWYWAGDNIYIGYSTNDIGDSLQFHINRMPQKMTSGTHAIDVKDSNVAQIVDMAVLTGLQILNIPLPGELQSAHNKLKELREKTMEERMNLLQKEQK